MYMFMYIYIDFLCMYTNIYTYRKYTKKHACRNPLVFWSKDLFVFWSKMLMHSCVLE